MANPAPHTRFLTVPFSSLAAQHPAARAPCGLIGIGGRLATPPLPHHRAYGSVPRRFDRVMLRRTTLEFGEDRGSRNSRCAGLVGPPGVRTYARDLWVN